MSDPFWLHHTALGKELGTHVHSILDLARKAGTLRLVKFDPSYWGLGIVSRWIAQHSIPDKRSGRKNKNEGNAGKTGKNGAPEIQTKLPTASASAERDGPYLEVLRNKPAGIESSYVEIGSLGMSVRAVS
jgi:hypothetical protein